MQDGRSRTEDATRQHTMTRREVAERLGVSTSSVRRLEFDELFPKEDNRGVWRFDGAEVEALAGRRGQREQRAPVRTAARSDPEGRLAARVFKMFGRGIPLAHIVVATRQSPATVRALYSEWSTTLEEGEWTRRREIE